MDDPIDPPLIEMYTQGLTRTPLSDPQAQVNALRLVRVFDPMTNSLYSWPNGPARTWIPVTAADLLCQLVGAYGTRAQRRALVRLLSTTPLPGDARLTIEPLVTGRKAIRTPLSTMPVVIDRINTLINAGDAERKSLGDGVSRRGTQDNWKTIRSDWEVKAQSMRALLNATPDIRPDTNTVTIVPFGTLGYGNVLTLGDLLMLEPNKPATSPITRTPLRNSFLKKKPAVAATKKAPATTASPAPAPTLDPDQQLAVARVSFTGLQQAWLDYTLNTEDYFLHRPALRDVSADADPAIAAYHRDWGIAASLNEEHPHDPVLDACVTEDAANSFAQVVAAAWNAWDTACRRALELSTTLQDPKITAASRRAVALINILADPTTTGKYREHVTDELTRKIDLLADPVANAHGPVDRSVVIALPELSAAAPLLQLTRERNRTQ